MSALGGAHGEVPQPCEPWYRESWYRVEPARWGFYITRGRGLLVRSAIPTWRPTRRWVERIGRRHLRHDAAAAARRAQVYTVEASALGGQSK